MCGLFGVLFGLYFVCLLFGLVCGFCFGLVFSSHCSLNQSSFLCALSLHFFLKCHVFLLLFIIQNYPAPPLASFTSFLGLFLHFLLLPFQSWVCFQCVFCCVKRKATQQNIFSILAQVPTSSLVIICSQIPKDILLWISVVEKKRKDTRKKFRGDLPIAEICGKLLLQSLNCAENNRTVDLGMPVSHLSTRLEQSSPTRGPSTACYMEARGSPQTQLLCWAWLRPESFVIIPYKVNAVWGSVLWQTETKGFQWQNSLSLFLRDTNAAVES